MVGGSLPKWALPPHNRDMRRLIPNNGMVPVAEG
jgi:hypothetical protein